MNRSPHEWRKYAARLDYALHKLLEENKRLQTRLDNATQDRQDLIQILSVVNHHLTACTCTFNVLEFAAKDGLVIRDFAKQQIVVRFAPALSKGESYYD